MDNYDAKLDQQIDLETSQSQNSFGSMTSKEGPLFFQVGTVKAALMCFFSFGLYDIFWMYFNWKYLKEHCGVKCLPSVRAFFAVLWAFSLFRHMIAEIEKRGGQKPSLGPGMLAASFIVGNLFSRIPGIFGDTISVFTILPIVMLQKQINAINGGEEQTANTKFSPLNWVLLVIGGLLWMLNCSGYFFKH